MAIFNTLANNPQLTLLILLVMLSLLALVTSLAALLLERQGSQLLLQRLSDLGYQLLEQQEDYKKIEMQQMAKEGLPGEKIQHLCGLTEGEVTLILDLHQ